MEVRAGLSKEDQIGVVVAALLDDEKSEALDWMKTMVTNTVSEIRAWETEAQARQLAEDQNFDNVSKLPIRETSSMLY